MPATIKINVNTTFNAYLYNTVPLHSRPFDHYIFFRNCAFVLLFTLNYTHIARSLLYTIERP